MIESSLPRSSSTWAECKQCFKSEDLNPFTLWFRKGKLETQYKNLPDREFHYYLAIAAVLYVCMVLIEALTATRWSILALSTAPTLLLILLFFFLSWRDKRLRFYSSSSETGSRRKSSGGTTGSHRKVAQLVHDGNNTHCTIVPDPNGPDEFDYDGDTMPATSCLAHTAYTISNTRWIRLVIFAFVASVICASSLVALVSVSTEKWNGRQVS